MLVSKQFDKPLDFTWENKWKRIFLCAPLSCLFHPALPSRNVQLRGFSSPVQSLFLGNGSFIRMTVWDGRSQWGSVPELKSWDVPIFEAAKVFQEISKKWPWCTFSIFFSLPSAWNSTFEEIQIREEIAVNVSRCLVICRISCFKPWYFITTLLEIFGFFSPSFLLPTNNSWVSLTQKEKIQVRSNFPLGKIKEPVKHIKSVGSPQATCTRRELISENCCNKPPCSHLNTAFARVLGQNVWLWKPLLDNKIIALGLQSSPRCRQISPAVPRGSCFVPLSSVLWSGWFFSVVFWPRVLLEHSPQQ